MAGPSRSSIFIPAANYSLGETLPSGQAFRWNEHNGGWEGIVQGRFVRLEQLPNGIRAEVWGDFSGDWEWLQHYLQTDVDIDAITSSFPADEHLKRAVESCRGLRLLRQDPWECLASFILSSTKQIVQIRQIVESLCRCFGELLPNIDGRELYSFPTAMAVAAATEEELRGCKMGFRAPYLKGTAEAIIRGEIDLQWIASLPTEQARSSLMALPGVGRKIADCVLLFAYGRQDAFPVDVWVMKALRQLYFPRRKPSPKRLVSFIETYFGPNAGYAQQYLFHYMRTQLGRK